ncbi:MAG: homoserine dehydrogenase [Firmicutes bacterium]|nr:homoserine dehydrogenase [Bacillota bacterium]
MKIAILGYGTVGSGCAEALKGSSAELVRVLDKREIPEIAHLLTDDYETILKDPDIELVAELMGGEHPAYDFVKEALLAGKHVVTANKQMLSHHFSELTKLAEEKGVCLGYSATAGGGIPWLENLKRYSRVDSIKEIGGVMNGTTNFILDAMQTRGESYDDALKKAQELGYAEADPTADVMGYDVRAKLAISCNLAFGGELDPESIPTTGITGITDETIKCAKESGMSVRLVAKAYMENGNIKAEIAPQLVGQDDPMYMLKGPENLFYLKGERCGTLSFRGAGAGKGPTGANVAADILKIIDRKEQNA